ncbi:hypothetical protein Tco_0271982 [Tanacetum coccineum]
MLTVLENKLVMTKTEASTFSGTSKEIRHFFQGRLHYSFWHKAIFFPPCKPSRSETCVSASVKEIDYAQFGVINQAELKLQPRAFFKLGHYGEIKAITDVVVDQMHQPWRTFATIINRSLSGKTSCLDKLCLSRAQILWGMYYKKNVDYVELLWEDFTYQIDNKGHKKQEKMYYPRFTKVIIHYFLTKDKTVSKRNKIGMHTSRDDYLINTLRFISANEES